MTLRFVFTVTGSPGFLFLKPILLKPMSAAICGFSAEALHQAMATCKFCLRTWDSTPNPNIAQAKADPSKQHLQKARSNGGRECKSCRGHIKSQYWEWSDRKDALENKIDEDEPFAEGYDESLGEWEHRTYVEGRRSSRAGRVPVGVRQDPEVEVQEVVQKEIIPRRHLITMRELEKYGFTPGCRGCEAKRRGDVWKKDIVESVAGEWRRR